MIICLYRIRLASSYYYIGLFGVDAGVTWFCTEEQTARPQYHTGPKPSLEACPGDRNDERGRAEDTHRAWPGLGGRVVRRPVVGLGAGPAITVGYGDPTPKKAGFSKEGTFGPSFGRTLMGKASKSVLRPAEGRPEDRL